MNPWIQNVSLADIPKGHHVAVKENSMLIQIVDPAMEFPVPKHQFREVHQFEFLDLEVNDPWGEEFKVTDDQADALAISLAAKIENEMTYPGQVRVTVIREKRAVGIAR